MFETFFGKQKPVVDEEKLKLSEQLERERSLCRDYLKKIVDLENQLSVQEKTHARKEAIAVKYIVQLEQFIGDREAEIAALKDDAQERLNKLEVFVKQYIAWNDSVQQMRNAMKNTPSGETPDR